MNGAVIFYKICYFQCGPTAWSGRRKLKRDMAFCSCQFDPVHFFELFYPALNLFCFSGFSTEALDKMLCLADLGLLVIICGTMNDEPLFLFSQVFAVVSFIDVEVTHAEFPSGSGHIVQEGPVMGNDDQTAGERR